jgi:acetyl esterase/lipase
MRFIPTPASIWFRVTPIILLALIALSKPSSLSAAEPETFSVWSGTPPGDENFHVPPANPKAKAAPKDDIVRLPLITDPTLTLFRPPAGQANGVGIIVCPGGGYNILAWNLEGTEVAEWLNSIGVTAVVLKYRVPRRDPARPHAAPLQDAQRAIRHVRQHAADWGIDAGRVGILGFSAGGNLAVMAATHWDEETYPKRDALDELSCRPDFVVPIYPAYLGDEKNPGPLSPSIRVTAKTPPVFMTVTHDDVLRGMNAAQLYVELKKANVPAELHIFSRGGHGYGLRKPENAVSQWPKLCEQWLRAQGYITR